eukprot:COSAG03_NODE_292_length_9302_cov_9.489188_6_plen_83_part_00
MEARARKARSWPRRTKRRLKSGPSASRRPPSTPPRRLGAWLEQRDSALEVGLILVEDFFSVPRQAPEDEEAQPESRSCVMFV